MKRPSGEVPPNLEALREAIEKRATERKTPPPVRRRRGKETVKVRIK